MSENKLEKITFRSEEGEELSFFVLEQTRIAGFDYLLVTEDEEGDGEAYILKDYSSAGEEMGRYEFVSDDAELDAVASVFGDMLEDVELTNEEN